MITFASPGNISGDADVSTSGALDRAYMFTGPEGGTVTINGVTFSRFTPFMGDTQTFSSAAEAFGTPGVPPYSGLSADYQTMLKGGFFRIGGASTFTLNNLAIGDLYEVQVFVNDSRAGVTSTRTQLVDDSLPLAFNVPQDEGGLGQFVLGTFVADAASQSLTFTPGIGGVAQINGLQLRNLRSAAPIPESANGVLLGAGVLGLVAFQARRQVQGCAGRRA